LSSLINSGAIEECCFEFVLMGRSRKVRRADWP
jgi:hypothetical protein